MKTKATILEIAIIMLIIGMTLFFSCGVLAQNDDYFIQDSCRWPTYWGDMPLNYKCKSDVGFTRDTHCNIYEVGKSGTKLITVRVPEWKLETKLLELFNDYSEYCYNDSTVQYYYTLCDWDCWNASCEKGDTIYKGIKGMEFICPEHWKHKQPTFEDFIKWLNNKNK